MSAGMKKFLNRGGLIAMVIGVIAYIIGGGDASQAESIITMAGGLAGTILVLVREIAN